MIVIPCPWCGPRDSDEFAYVGEPRRRPEPRTTTPREWRDYLYLRSNKAGWRTERWYHRFGCRRYLLVERDTLTNAVREHTEQHNGAEP